MLEPGTVKAGDELVYEFGNRVKQHKIVKVREVSSVIILENGVRATLDGKPIGLSSYDTELYPLPRAEQS